MEGKQQPPSLSEAASEHVRILTVLHSDMGAHKSGVVFVFSGANLF